MKSAFIGFLLALACISKGYSQQTGVAKIEKLHSNCIETQPNILLCLQMRYDRLDSLMIKVYNNKQKQLIGNRNEQFKAMHKKWIGKRDRYFVALSKERDNEIRIEKMGDYIKAHISELNRFK